MKKWLILGMLLLLLTGCGTQEAMETVSDEYLVPVGVLLREVAVELPAEAASPAVESDSGRLYLCNGYEISIQTLQAGDLNATVRAISGYDQQDLTVMYRPEAGIDRYEFVWACVGEDGDQVGRAAVLDDGANHYVLSVLGDADMAKQNQPVWVRMFQTFHLA